MVEKKNHPDKQQQLQNKHKQNVNIRFFIIKGKSCKINSIKYMLLNNKPM